MISILRTTSKWWCAHDDIIIHYNDVIMGAITSQITSLTIFTQLFIQTQIKENIKAPRHWPLCGEFTGDRWIPRTNGQLRGKCFHLMTSLCWRIMIIIMILYDQSSMKGNGCKSVIYRFIQLLRSMIDRSWINDSPFIDSYMLWLIRYRWIIIIEDDKLMTHN